MNKPIANLETLAEVIGNTPLYIVTLKYKGEVFRVYAKAEQYNFTGSIKDRMAFYILRKALQNKVVTSDMELAEATSGNTGISFAAVGAALGLRVNIFMPDWMSEERKALIQSYGAKIVQVSKEQGGFLGSIDLANQHCEKHQECYLPSQFDNADNCLAHKLSTAPEILEQMSSLGLDIDAFVAGVGTGGTVMGVYDFFQAQELPVRVYPLEPANSPTLSTGHKVGSHRIQGISDEFIPSIMQLNKLHDVLQVDDGDAIIMAQKLSKVGIGVGISSGANLLGTIIAAKKIGFDKNIVTVFADDNKKYMSTDLMKKEAIKESHISKDVEILSYECVRRSNLRGLLEG